MATKEIDYLAAAKAAMAEARRIREEADAELVRAAFATREQRKLAVYARLASGEGPLFAALREEAANHPALMGRMEAIGREEDDGAS